MNKIILCGRLCDELDLKTTMSGHFIANFSFAVNRRFKKEGGPDADFFNCVAFGKTAETLKRCSVGKGTKLLICGEMQNNDFVDAGGLKHYRMQVVIDEFEFCEKKQQANDTPTINEDVPTFAPEINTLPLGMYPTADEELPY